MQEWMKRVATTHSFALENLREIEEEALEGEFQTGG